MKRPFDRHPSKITTAKGFSPDLADYFSFMFYYS